MKHALGPRKELGFRTIFNLLGPLTNPAEADYQIVGVFDRELTAPLAEVLGRLGVRRCMVIHGAGAWMNYPWLAPIMRFTLMEIIWLKW